MNDDLGRLVRSASLAPRPAAAKARFLRSTSPARPWPVTAAAALFVSVALASVFSRLESPRAVVPDTAPARQNPAWIELSSLIPDGAIALRARLPVPRAKAPLLHLEGSAELPDRFVLLLLLQREEESFDGRRLIPRLVTLQGGFARILRGRFEQDAPWVRPGVLRVRATLQEQDQGPEIRIAIKGKYPIREWNFSGAAWTGAAANGLAPDLDGVDAAAAEFIELAGRFEKACVSEERWKLEAPALKPAARDLRDRLEKLKIQTLLPASVGFLLSAARNLDGDSAHFVWKMGVFQGPTSYHADQQTLKTFRGDAWTFAAFRRYAEEAPAVAGRETALWIVKDLRRGTKTDVDALSKRPGIAAYADRLRAGEGLDALEEDIRAGR